MGMLPAMLMAMLVMLPVMLPTMLMLFQELGILNPRSTLFSHFLTFLSPRPHGSGSESHGKRPALLDGNLPDMKKRKKKKLKYTPIWV